jgi:hypothetical protein
MGTLNFKKVFIGLLVPIALVFLGQKATAHDEAGFLAKVLAHANVQKVESKIAEDGFTYLQKVEKAQTYRCMGCFLYDLTYERYTESGKEQKVVRLYTSLDLMLSEVNVRVVEE